MTQYVLSGSTGSTVSSGQAIVMPYAFTTGILHDPAFGAWNFDTGASSHLNNLVNGLSENFNTSDGTLSRYKAQLVANRSTQLEGVDVDETFSLVVKPGTIRTVLSLPTSRHWPVHQLDEFGMTDLGSLNYFLGISVTRDSPGMFLPHTKYVVKILKRAGMVNCNPSRTPVDTESKLDKTGDVVCLHMHDPREPHFSTPKRILRYVCSTLDYGLQLFSSSTTDLVAYSDADWSVDLLLDDRIQAEYRGVVNAVAETYWLRNLLRELHTPLSFATLVYCDKFNAVYLSSNPIQHQRTNHIKIDIYFVRDLVATGHVWALHVPSRYQFEDIFTKGLPTALFEEFHSNLSVRCPPAITAREYDEPPLWVSELGNCFGCGIASVGFSGAKGCVTFLSYMDFLTRRVLLRCDSTGDLYPVTAPSPIPHDFLVSQHTWHQHLGHPGGEVLHRLVSSNFISCNKKKLPVLCHACQLGKHVRLPFVSSGIVISFCFDIIHSDTLVPRPLNVSVVRYMWLFRHKYLADGTLSRYKAQLVADGSTQLEGVDVDETFSSVVKPGTIRIVLSLPTSRHWPVHHLDMKYVVKILEHASMVNCNPIRTPVDTESKLSITGDVVCLHMHDPREPHFSTPKWILCYVCSTLDYGLHAEAEYRGVANAVAETCWLCNLLRELHTLLSSVMLVFCDNVSAVYLSSNPIQHQRTKHIEIDIHFVRDLVATGQVRALHVHSRYQFKDIFTKGLPTALFEEFHSNLSVRCPPAITVREC
nr:ribonuclease H-like domain-containing protein [Tanacetum cinerariifolium]